LAIPRKKAWIARQSKDPFVKQRIQSNLASRACFKLEQIHSKFRLFKRGDWVLDLGAAPGGWSQIASQYVGKEGRVIGIDLLPVQVELENAKFIQGDMHLPQVQEEISKWLLTQQGNQEKLNSLNLNSPMQDITFQTPLARKFDVILSDMAHEFGGNPSIDVPRVQALVESALAMCHSSLIGLEKGGSFAAKFLQGQGDQGNPYYRLLWEIYKHR
jgi:23S rRNA (uridine2552-2'-O)-methyltransferase